MVEPKTFFFGGVGEFWSLLINVLSNEYCEKPSSPAFNVELCQSLNNCFKFCFHFMQDLNYEMIVQILLFKILLRMMKDGWKLLSFIFVILIFILAWNYYCVCTCCLYLNPLCNFKIFLVYRVEEFACAI